MTSLLFDAIALDTRARFFLSEFAALDASDSVARQRRRAQHARLDGASTSMSNERSVSRAGAAGRHRAAHHEQLCERRQAPDADADSRQRAAALVARALRSVLASCNAPLVRADVITRIAVRALLAIAAPECRPAFPLLRVSRSAAARRRALADGANERRNRSPPFAPRCRGCRPTR